MLRLFLAGALLCALATTAVAEIQPHLRLPKRAFCGCGAGEGVRHTAPRSAAGARLVSLPAHVAGIRKWSRCGVITSLSCSRQSAAQRGWCGTQFGRAQDSRHHRSIAGWDRQSARLTAGERAMMEQI